MGDWIRVTIDGREVRTERGKMLLELINDLGIYLPQLCNHPSLSPSGACRLCLVEITKAEWKSESRLVASCLYPVEEGLIVKTRSEEVLKTRRSLLELYLAQCPDSEEIKALARMEGIDSSHFKLEPAENNCILCGLCTRVCQDCGPGAISTQNRGAEKLVGPRPDGVAEDCTGCRACAEICPTVAIPIKQEKGILEIWNRSFEIATCSVQPEICRGCGRCEEVCPFDIPRVSIYRNGLSVSSISQSACVGCGICAGSCPTGAISQNKTENLSIIDEVIYSCNLKDQNIIFACPRSPLPADLEGLVRVSCIGNIDLQTMLYCIASGAKSVSLLCRDRLSCPYMKGGDLGEERMRTADAILRFCGFEQPGLYLLQPEQGQEGPLKAWQEHLASNLGSKHRVAEPFYRRNEKLSGLDLALDIIKWLKEHPALSPLLPDSYREIFAESDHKATTVLYPGRAVELSLLMHELIDQRLVSEKLREAVQFLKSRGITFYPVFKQQKLSAEHIKEVIILNPLEADVVPEGKKKCSLYRREKESSTGDNDFIFTLSPQNRKELLNAYLESSDRLVCSGIEAYLQYALLLRPGSWQQSLAEKPYLVYHEAESSRRDQEKLQITDNRIVNHPILTAPQRDSVSFTFNGRKLEAQKGEVITSALYASGIAVFGHHKKDGSAQGIYCVNGQCSQCMVIADDKPVKGCMTIVTEGMKVESVEGVPHLSDLPSDGIVVADTTEVEVDVLIIGGGPAGISAAIELGNAGVNVLIVDDKNELGGKLSLQTHNFFGSVADCYAGYRGIKIGQILSDQMLRLPTVDVWFNATVVGVFSDCKFGVSMNGSYKLVRAKQVLFATGAREKSLAFPGADLPGVYGAGAFQTLVNRDLIRCAERLFIVGGGNVGLIGAYHALQAGIDVVGLVEALPKCGGYKVHEDKIKRMGVPVLTSHTVLRIEGRENVESVVIAAVDDKFNPIEGTERQFEVDTVLIAVGLSPVDELYRKAVEYGIKTHAAGDAEEIAEASAAIFSGRITGRRIAQELDFDLPVPSDWEDFGMMLKHRPGESLPFEPEEGTGSAYPLIRCMQEIPCNPCTEVCPNNCISMPGSILALPEFEGECLGCGKCVLACPGLAINLVLNGYDPKKEKALLMMPFEFVNDIIPLGKEVITTDMEGEIISKGRVIAYRERAGQDSRRLLLLEVPYEERLKVAAFRIREIDEGKKISALSLEDEDPIVCRCERVRKSDIVRAIRDGVRDMNQLKALLRTGLGGCNGKTCTDLILRIYREEGVPLSEVTLPTNRPLVAEMHLGDFIAAEQKEPEHAGK